MVPSCGSDSLIAFICRIQIHQQIDALRIVQSGHALKDRRLFVRRVDLHAALLPSRMINNDMPNRLRRRRKHVVLAGKCVDRAKSSIGVLSPRFS
jgi:hypothetical protein